MDIIKALVIGAAAFILQTSPARAQGGDIVATGTFHGAAHKTSGRATVYSVNEKETLRLTNFKTSNGPDMHVVLIAASDAQDNEKFLEKNLRRVGLGMLKGNEGDQDYAIPPGTDL
ncbi:MAG: DM13 domain-containing protein [Bryobacteraceae bacterium]